MLLTLEKFLSHFNINNVYKDGLSKEEFTKQLVITYKNDPTLYDIFNFKSVIKHDQDKRYILREKIIDYFYELLYSNKNKYLAYFYDAYFRFEDPYSMNWNPSFNIWKNHSDNAYLQNEKYLKAFKDYTEYNTSFLNNKEYDNIYDNIYDNMLLEFNNYLDSGINAISLQMNDNSRRIVRNINYFDILHTTKVTNTCKSSISFWESLTDAYNKFILADRFFAPSSIDLFLKKKNQKTEDNEINYNNFYYLFQQYQPKASILNPYTISWIFNNYLGIGKEKLKLFTPVLSWCTYIISYVFSEYTEYVGVDVLDDVCKRTEYLFKYLKDNAPKNHSIHNKSPPVLYTCPSESLLYNKDFMSKYVNYFDTVIMCPPYYNMEIYHDGEQSIKNYPEYDDWLDNYWENTVALSYKVLKTGGKFSFIVNNYDSLDGKSYPLINDLNMIVLKYFKLSNCFQLVNRGSPLRMNFKDRTEMLFIYEKE